MHGRKGGHHPAFMPGRTWQPDKCLISGCTGRMDFKKEKHDKQRKTRSKISETERKEGTKTAGENPGIASFRHGVYLPAFIPFRPGVLPQRELESQCAGV